MKYKLVVVFDMCIRFARRLRSKVRDLAGSYFYATRSYSQEGEDIVLQRLFEGKAKGFYVDIGCHHPFRFSNTYLFYKKGWKGVCIDPLPGTLQLFRRWRPRDIALQIGVSSAPSKLIYYMFNEPALNTFDPILADNRTKLPTCTLIDERIVETYPLCQILEQHLPVEVKRIDLISIDVEGLDFDVLKSNDWFKFPAKAVVIESYESDFSALGSSEVGQFLQSLGYKIYAKTGYSVIYIRNDEDVSL